MYSSRHTPTGSQEGHSYPPNMSSDSEFAAPQRPFRQTSSSSSSSLDESLDPSARPLDRNSPYSYSSTPSLPRYSSGQSSSSYLPQPSPLNPTATRGGGQVNVSSRYSAYGGNGVGNGNAHPLSNAMYADSSPTLAGSETLGGSANSDEKTRLGAKDAHGDYLIPATRRDPSPHSGSSSSQSNSFTDVYRRQKKPSGLTAVYRAISGASLADSGKDERHIKLPRLGYLDGCKFIAAWVVLNGTLFDAVLTDNEYSAIQRNSPLYITRSTGLGITFLLMLMGRSLVTPLWDVPAPQPGSKTNNALISWARLTRAMLIRPFRFILPVLVVVALQWGLDSTGKTNNCNAVGMDKPYWGLITNFAGFSTLVFDLFTWYEQDTTAGKTFAANLFTAPWFFQASYAVYTIHFMLGNLSSNRYWVYGMLATFSWSTYNYFFPAIIGLAIADMHAHGHLHRIRTKWPAYKRLTLHGVLIVIALIFQWVPVIRDNVNSGLAVLNVQDHPELTICDAIFCACWLLAIETSGLAQNILGNVVMRTLGKLSPGMYLLAPAITFTIVPNVALSMHNNGSSASSILGTSWVVLFFITIALAIPFHFVVELPSKMLGEVFAELLESADGTGGRIRRSKDGSNKLIRKHVGGGALKKQQPEVPPKAAGKPVLA